VVDFCLVQESVGAYQRTFQTNISSLTYLISRAHHFQ
jgi:hypothetical protein